MQVPAQDSLIFFKEIKINIYTLIVKKEALLTKRDKVCDFIWYKGEILEVEFTSDEQSSKTTLKYQRAFIKVEDIIGLSLNDRIGYSKTIKFDNCQEADYNKWLIN